MGLLLSQDDMARALRDAGVRAGEPNDASKRLVQRWEAGVVAAPRPVYARALESVTGLPIEALGFSVPVPGEGEQPEAPTLEPAPPQVSSRKKEVAAVQGQGNHSGVWLSRYEYVSSGRGNQTFTGLHYVVILQHGNRLTVRSLPSSSDSPLTMDLTVDRNVVTGSWTEQTAEDGYYQGATYHGAIQLLIEPTGRRMVGKWVGFGREFEVNTGPWELVFKDASTNKATLDQYNLRPS